MLLNRDKIHQIWNALMQVRGFICSSELVTDIIRRLCDLYSHCFPRTLFFTTFITNSKNQRI